MITRGDAEGKQSSRRVRSKFLFLADRHYIVWIDDLIGGKMRQGLHLHDVYLEKLLHFKQHY